MGYFNLPIQTKKNKSIPKNSFYEYTTNQQKLLFAEVVDKIKWESKLSIETINLTGLDVKEIQVIEISLKKKANIEKLLPIIEKAIPYHIIFTITYGDEMMLYTSQKHAHPTNENIAVVDWIFKTNWFLKTENNYTLVLKENLDKVFRDFCFQISNSSINSKQNLKELIEKERKIKDLKNQIQRIEYQLNKTKQFNKKQPLNSELNKLKEELLSMKAT